MKERKTEAELKSIVLEELRNRGLPGVRDISLYHVIDSSSPFTWEVSVISLGDEDEHRVNSALSSFQRSLQERYDLSDWT